MNDVLALLPGLRRFAYLSSLFDWLRRSLEAAHNSTVGGYPEIPASLLESLQSMAEEIGSVPLLEYCEKLRALNRAIRSIQGSGGDAAAMRLHLEHLPPVEDEYRRVRKDCLKAVAAWLVIPVLIVLVISLRSCCL